MEPVQPPNRDDVPSIAYRPRRRKGPSAVPTERPKREKGPAKRPVKLMLDEAVYETLVIHGLRRGESLSELVSNLARTHLTDYVIHHKPGRKSEAG